MNIKNGAWCTQFKEKGIGKQCTALNPQLLHFLCLASKKVHGIACDFRHQFE